MKIYLPSVQFQRALFLRKIENNHSVLTGWATLAQYNSELRTSLGALSPFWWGDICYRDFEALVNRCVVIKPDMDHIRTWPGVYVPNQTYVPVRWDGSDLVERCEMVLSDPGASRLIADAAWSAYASAIDGVEERVEHLLAGVDGDSQSSPWPETQQSS